MLGFVPVLGCQSATPEDMDNLERVVRMTQEIAEANNAAWHIRATIDGKPRVGETVEFYLDTGVDVEISIQGNAGKSVP